MQQPGCSRGVWRRLFFFAIIGFIVIVAGGPVISVLAAIFSIAVTVVAVLLPFALLGVVIWLPLRWLCRRPKRTWAEAGRRTGRFCRGAIAVPLHASHRAASACRSSSVRVYRTGHFLGAVLTEVFCGSLVVGLLGWLCGLPPYGPTYQTVLVSAILGGLLGMFLAVCRCRSERELSVT